MEYLALENQNSPFGPANSIAQTTSASIRVTVGFTPVLQDRPHTDPPILLRFKKGPSQTQAMDCGTGASNQAGWNGKMKNEYQRRSSSQRAQPGELHAYPDLLTPPDCVASENGHFNSNGLKQLWGQGCPNAPATPNNWTGSGDPPPTDPRWILFILDERSTTISGKKYYPIRRFGGFYVTAGDGLDCNGDDPSYSLDSSREIWGHFITCLPHQPRSNNSIERTLSFTDADLCVPVWLSELHELHSP